MNNELIIFSSLFMVWVFSLGKLCPCPSTKKNDGCLRYEIYGVQPNHFVLFAALGYKFPEYFYTLQILGIIWELFESYLGLYKPLWFFKNNKNNSSNSWHGRISDIFVNCIGFLIGSNLRFTI